MHLEVPELDHKRPMYYDVIERRTFTFASESLKALMQIGY